MQYNCVVNSKNNRFVVLVSVCFCVLLFSLQVASVMLITFTRWLFRARLWLLITFIASQFIFAFLKNSKLSAKLLIFFMCGGFMSSLRFFFLVPPFSAFPKVSHRLRYRRTAKRIKEKFRRGNERRCDRDGKYPYRTFSFAHPYGGAAKIFRNKMKFELYLHKCCLSQHGDDKSWHQKRGCHLDSFIPQKNPQD